MNKDKNKSIKNRAKQYYYCYSDKKNTKIKQDKIIIQRH